MKLKREKRLMGVVAVCAMLAPQLAGAVNLVHNGNFEAPFSTPPYYRYLHDGDDTTIPGWTAIDDGIAEPGYIFNIGAYSAVVEGANSIFMNQGAGLETRVPLVAGQSYELRFYAKEWHTYLAFEPLQVSVGTLSRSFASPNGYTRLVFTADTTDPAAVLRFYNPSPVGDFRGYVFDDVSLKATAVPEPATAVLAAFGLVLLAWHARGGTYR